MKNFSLHLTGAEWDSIVLSHIGSQTLLSEKLNEIEAHSGYNTYINKYNDCSWEYGVSADNGILELTEGELLDVLNKK